MENERLQGELDRTKKVKRGSHTSEDEVDLKYFFF